VIIVKEYAKPQAQRGKALFMVPFGGGEVNLTVRRNKTVTKLLVPVITSGCQSISLINKPLVLHKNAAARTAKWPANLGSFESFGPIVQNNRENFSIKEVQLKLQF
jgi:hypothetical protein